MPLDTPFDDKWRKSPFGGSNWRSTDIDGGAASTDHSGLDQYDGGAAATSYTKSSSISGGNASTGSID